MMLGQNPHPGDTYITVKFPWVAQPLPLGLDIDRCIIVAVCKKVVKTQRRVILFLKVLDVILKCGTKYSGFEPVGLQKWCLKLATGKYKMKGK